jgi:tetratricopeptide (TPR) repeat protein
LMIRLWDLTAATRFMRLFRLGIVALLIFAAESEASLTRRYLVYWQNTESLYSYMIEMAPKAPVLYNNFGVFYYKNGKVNKAAEEWSIAAALDPDYPDALNNLAWVLATNKDAQKRDGRKAIILAQKACRLTDYKDAAKLDTLAAAYAEVGEFDKAVAAIQEGIQIAQSSERKELANEMVERLKLYREGKTFHQRQ